MSRQPATDANAIQHTPDAIRAISALSDLFHNGDTTVENTALDAFQRGREAYWSQAGYSNQRAGRLLAAANRFGLETALRNVADDTRASYAARTPYLLGSLIPLNKPAMEAVARAWAELDEAPRNARVAEPFRSALNAVGL